MSQPHSGFTADSTALRTAADNLRSLPDPLAVPDTPAEAFGHSGPGPQLAAGIAELVERHTAEANALLDRLRSIGDELAGTALGHDTREDAAAQRFGQIGSRQDGGPDQVTKAVP